MQQSLYEVVNHHRPGYTCCTSPVTWVTISSVSYSARTVILAWAFVREVKDWKLHVGLQSAQKKNPADRKLLSSRYLQLPNDRQGYNQNRKVSDDVANAYSIVDMSSVHASVFTIFFKYCPCSGYWRALQHHPEERGESPCHHNDQHDACYYSEPAQGENTDVEHNDRCLNEAKVKNWRHLECVFELEYSLN